MSILCSCWSVDLALFALTVVGLVYLYATWNYNHWKKLGIPFLKPYPLVGNLKDSTSGQTSMGEVYAEIYNNLKQYKYGGFYKSRQPALMICDPDLIKTILLKEFHSFHDNDIDVSIEMDPMFGRNPFVLTGEKWKTVRSQLTPAFTPGKLKPLFPLMNEVCQDMKTYIEKEDPESLEAKELIAKYTTDVTASCIFGLNGNSFTDPEADFRNIGREIMKGGFWPNIQAMLLFTAPSIATFFKLRFFPDSVSNFFRRVTKEAMNYREENNVIRNDFLQLLMQLKAKGGFEDDDANVGKAERFTDEDVAAQTITFFTDGFETSSSALSFALYELAVNPDVQEQLRTEVDAVMEKYNGKLSYEMLQDMPYAEMVLAEALRKYPPLPFLTRRCTKPFDLPTPDGTVYQVPVGTSIAISVLGLQMNHEYFPEPEIFDPHRFNVANKAARHPYVHLPFGAGPRACLGSRFAKMQMMAGLASTVSNFEIELCERSIVPVVIDPISIVLAAKGGLWVKFVKRTDK